MRLIDADELRSGLFHLEGETGLTDRQLGYQAGWNDALIYGVLDAPTVDAVEVVRCKDCRHAGECHKSVQYAHNESNTVTIGYLPIKWCSRGERKEDAGE